MSCFFSSRIHKLSNLHYSMFVIGVNLNNCSYSIYKKNDKNVWLDSLFTLTTNVIFKNKKAWIILCNLNLHRPFSLQTLWPATVGKAQVLLIMLTMTPIYSAVAVSNRSVTVSLKPKQLNGIQPSLILLLTAMLFLLLRWKMSSIKKGLFRWSFSGIIGKLCSYCVT